MRGHSHEHRGNLNPERTTRTRGEVAADPSAALRQRGLRVTASRLAVLDLLTDSPSPLTHQEVVEHFQGSPWNRSTLYRNLIDLAEVGLAAKSEIGGLMRFERTGRENACAEHPHFVCTDCGTVTHLDAVTVHFEGRGPQAVTNGHIEVQLRGRCDDCG